MHKPQRGENCTVKSLMSLLHGDLMRNLGETQGKALYHQVKNFRGIRNYNALLELLAATPPEVLKNIYGVRSDRKLEKELAATHKRAQSVLTHWNRKAAKTAASRVGA
ncbi:unknown protein [Simkania negevensis Z]|uniref:Uncharacterized protein n=2 Tax=Simkania negevensis TaxID=83561 RepID=F8L7V3_SIMNZ|nr:hypothetical protein [Simkania sp.]CCB88855.1 unknown protein [Simkania negevensis Z]